MGEEIPMMSSDEFKYHMNEFMSHMRQFEERMAKNWDIVTKFQEVMMNTVKNMLHELQKNERITNIERIVDTLQGHMNSVLEGFREGVREMKNIKQEMRSEISAFEYERKKVHDLFDYLNPQAVSQRGAEAALKIVKEFQESYEFLKNVREALSGKEIETLGKLPRIQHDPSFDLPVGSMRLPRRTTRSLKMGGCETIGDVYRCGARGLAKMRGIGASALREIIQYFEGKKITLE